MDQALLENLYLKRKMSSRQVASTLKCSEGRVNYWLAHYAIPKRSISEAVYAAWNPGGDPFLAKVPHSQEESLLFGLGIGLYWGEGNKRNASAVRLCNSDPDPTAIHEIS